MPKLKSKHFSRFHSYRNEIYVPSIPSEIKGNLYTYLRRLCFHNFFIVLENTNKEPRILIVFYQSLHLTCVTSKNINLDPTSLILYRIILIHKISQLIILIYLFIQRLFIFSVEYKMWFFIRLQNIIKYRTSLNSKKGSGDQSHIIT